MRRFSSSFSCVRLRIVSRREAFCASASEKRALSPTSSTCSADTRPASSPRDGVGWVPRVRDTTRLYTIAINALKQKRARLVELLSVKTTTRRARLDADPFVDHLEDRVAYHHVLIAFSSRSRQLELPSVQLLVDHDHPGAIPGQHLHRVTALAHEHEQRARPRLCPHALANHAPQPLAAIAHVDRLERDVDRKSVSNHLESLPNTATTPRNSSATKPASIRIEAPPTCATNAPSGVAAAGPA